MPDATITSTASTFGTISGTFAADQSTITGTITAITGTVDGSVGVPGPQGPAGSQGPQGPAGAPGAPGQGVAAGGSTGQVLQKLSATSYDTGWLTLPADYITSVTAPLDVTSGNLSVNLSAYLPLAGGYMTGAIFNTNAIGGLYLSNFSLGAGWYTNVSWSGIELSGGAGPTAQSMTIQGDGITFATSPYKQTTPFLGLAGYATEAWVTNGFYPLAGNPSGFLTDAPSDGSQYARKNAAWDVVIPGDRYLTTSTTSNTLSNTTKTFTIGTGLSYTPTQNITISYDASNHMHGEVLTYNSGTGVLTVDVNNHTGSGTYTAWVVNVGGVTPATSVAWGDITGTLSAQTDLQSALDLKANLASPTFTGTPVSTTAAVDTNTTQIATTAYVVGNGYLKSATASSTYAPLASPTFTGTPTLPTGTIATTQSPGNNTTALATTAFVTAAVPAFATNAEAIAGTSTTTSLSPALAPSFLTHPECRPLAYFKQTAVSGSGGVTASSIDYGAREMYLPTLAVGRAGWMYGITGANIPNMSRADWRKVDFSKKIWLSGRAMAYSTTGFGSSYPGDANTFARITLGGYSTNTTGDMTMLGIGWKKQGGLASVYTLSVHNGTTLTNVATSVSATDNSVIDWVLYSEGNGNVSFYINGTLAASTSAGPTGITASYAGMYREQVEAATTPTARQILETTGGWLYMEA